MNLYSRKVYRLELNDAYNPTSVVSVTSYAIPSVAVTNGELRPFAVQYHRGKVYCGAVASGENGGTNIVDGATDLYAHVIEMTNPLGSAAFNSTPILSYPLNYQKGYTIVTMNTAALNKWFPWTNNSESYLSDPYGEGMYPTPLLSNIDFTDRGDMIMDFTDRSGHQWGYLNYRNLSTTIATSVMDIGGDVLIAGRNCSTGAWTLENDGSINSNGTTLTGNSTTNNEGPGSGEFFAQDRATDDYHHETSQGAVAIVPGTTNGIFTLMDPVGIFQGGTGRFNTENGIDGNRTVLYGGADGEFGKANGLGDIEVAGQEPPIEIGNRVWLDANGNGIQDAGENGIANVTIELFCDTNNDGLSNGGAIATVDTDPDGYWYFNANNVIDGDCSLSGDQAGPQPGKSYVVKIGSADWTGGNGVSELNLLYMTTLNATVVGIADASDNDAELVVNKPQIALTTQKLGQNDHSFDFGFKPCVADAGANLALDCNTPSGTIGTAASGTDTYSWAPSTGLDNPNIAQPTASPSVTTTYTLTVNSLCTDEVTVTVDNTAPTADAGVNKDLDCTTTSTTIGTAAIAGNTYSWAPSTNLSSTSIAEPTANPTASTNYTVTVTGSNGCTATDVVSVNVNTAVPTADAGVNKDLDCTTTSTTIGTAAVLGNTYSWAPATILSATNIAEPTASPTTTTNYTVTVTGSNGCSATDVVSVKVNTSAPTADAGLNKNLDCTTTSTTIGTSAIVGNTYSWSPATNLSATNIAEPTANPNATTNYTVTVTGSNGCSATDVVSVNVDTTPPTVSIVGATTVCNGNTTTLNANGGVSWTWLPNNEITQSITAGAGSYTVTATGANGCTNTDMTTLVTVEGNIGNYVWFDANGNGLNDELASSGINGVQVELWKETSSGSNVYTLVQSATTANDNLNNPGYYNFVICESANYKVKFPLTQGGQGITKQTSTAGADNNSDASLTDGNSPVIVMDVNGAGIAKNNFTIDAGYFKPAQLGNYVWNDINKDGIQDNAEVGVAGITVTLFDNSNTVVSATITDAYGYYKFAPLDPGTYHVGFTLPANYVFTLPNISTDEVDNDVNPITGITGDYVIVSGDSNMTVDAGIYFQQRTTASVGNYVWLDVNQDGLQNNNEQGISGVTVTLYNNAGVPVATMLTDADGFYLFTEVVPGNYTVGFTPPAGLTFSPNNGGVANPSNSDASPLSGITSSFAVNAGDKITYVDAGLYRSKPRWRARFRRNGC